MHNENPLSSRFETMCRPALQTVQPGSGPEPAPELSVFDEIPVLNCDYRIRGHDGAFVEFNRIPEFPGGTTTRYTGEVE